MIHLKEEDLFKLRSILEKYPYNICAYGSRTRGDHKKFSDLDLCIMDEVDYIKLGNMQEELDESDISIKVSVKRWREDMSDDFRKLIKDDLILLQNK